MLIALLVTASVATSPRPELVVQGWHPGPATAVPVRFTPDGAHLITVSDTSTIVWDTKTGLLERTMTPEQSTRLLKSLPRIVTTLQEEVDPGIVQSPEEGSTRFSIESGERMRAFSVSNITLATDAFGGRTHTLSPDDITKYSAGRGTVFHHGFLSPDGNLVTLYGEGQAVHVFDIDTGLEVASLPDSDSLLRSPDGWQFATVGNTGRNDITVGTTLYDLRSRSVVARLGSHTAVVEQVAFRPDGTHLVSADVLSLRLWDVVAGREESVAGERPWRLFAQNQQRLVAAWASDAASGFSGLAVFDLAGRREITHRDLPFRPASLALASSGEVLVGEATARNNRQTPVHVLDPVTLQTLRTFNVQLDTFQAPAFSPDGTLVATVTYDSMFNTPHPELFEAVIRIYDTATGKVVHDYHRQSIGAAPGRAMMFPGTVMFAPDSKRIAVGSTYGSGTLVIDLTTGKDVVNVQGGEPLAFSSDGQKMVLRAAKSNEAFVADIAGVPLARYAGHTGRVTAAAFSPDGSQVVTAAEDRTMQLWRSASAAPIASLIGVDAKEYVVALPTGYFAASPAAQTGVASRLGERALPLQQFDLRLDRPDLVVQALGGPESLVHVLRVAHEKRVKLSGLVEDHLSDSALIPDLHLVGDRPPVATPANLLDLKVAIKASAELDRLLVVVNGVPQGGSHGVSLREQKVRTLELPVRVELASGSNHVEIYAVDAAGVDSSRERFDITCSAPPIVPDLYVVALGVSEYADADHNVEYASDDATELASLMKRAPGFDHVRVLRLRDNKVVRKRFLKVREFLADARVEDLAVVFVTGQTVLDANLDYWFATADLDFDHPETRGIAYTELERLLDETKARRKLLLMDTLEPGEAEVGDAQFVPSATVGKGRVTARALTGRKAPRRLGIGDSAELLRALLGDVYRDAGTVTVATATSLELMVEAKKTKSGLFSYALFEGLRTGSADLDKDGFIRVSELRDYASDRVEQLSGGHARPAVRRENLDPDWVVQAGATGEGCQTAGPPSLALVFALVLALRRSRRAYASNGQAKPST